MDPAWQAAQLATEHTVAGGGGGGAVAGGGVEVGVGLGSSKALRVWWRCGLALPFAHVELSCVALPAHSLTNLLYPAPPFPATRTRPPALTGHPTIP